MAWTLKFDLHLLKYLLEFNTTPLKWFISLPCGIILNTNFVLFTNFRFPLSPSLFSWILRTFAIEAMCHSVANPNSLCLCLCVVFLSFSIILMSPQHLFSIPLRPKCILWQVDNCYGTIHEECEALLSPCCHVAFKSTTGVSTSKWLWHLSATCQLLMPCNYQSFNPQLFMHGYKILGGFFQTYDGGHYFIFPTSQYIFY